MNKNLQLIAIIIVTFLIVMATSTLLEFTFFKHWLRQILIILFILIELFLGYILFKYTLNL